MNLNEIKPGESCRVSDISLTGPLKRRILDMGVTKGVKVKVMKIAPLGDPIELSVRGYNLSLRKKEAENIEVTMEGSDE